MKKSLIFLLVLCLGLPLMAQRSGSTTAIGAGTLKVLTMTAADSVTKQGTSYWIFDINKARPYYFCVAVACDTVAHANLHVYFDVLGSMDGTNFVATTATQVKYGATVDSTFQLTDVSTGVLWRYLKLKAVGQNSSIKGPRVTGLSVKIGEKY